MKKSDSYAGHVADSAAFTVSSAAAAGAAPPGAMGRGVLRPDLAADRFGLAKYQPSVPLAPFVDYYWIVRWDLRGEPPYEQTILPHPNVHLAFEASGHVVLRSVRVEWGGQGQARTRRPGRAPVGSPSR